MSEFKRNASKVWWASDSLEYRSFSTSPNSQDSGFSDSEASPKPEGGAAPHSRKHSPRVSRSLFGEGAAAALPEAAEEALSQSLSSDCESELEGLFGGGEAMATSTPKSARMGRGSLRIRQILPEAITNAAVSHWMVETKRHYDPECMTALQSKSISADLTLKVQTLAAALTSPLTSIIRRSRRIEAAHRHLAANPPHASPLAQSLSTDIFDFLRAHAPHAITDRLQRELDAVRRCARPVGALFDRWRALQRVALDSEVGALMARLERPASEMGVRGAVTALTCLALHHDCLAALFARRDAVPVLLTLAEKCEGSSTRALLLRALATLATSAATVRQFEQYAGLQVVVDALAGARRPEPERAEAVALLAQVTAPWIEDGHCLRGLERHADALTAALAQLVGATRCCQSLLLAAAALANLGAMGGACVAAILRHGAVEALLGAVRERGACVAVCVQEQVATVVASVSGAGEAARGRLAAAGAVGALLRFLQAAGMGGEGEEAGMRLQQKAMIALSRLCGDEEAAREVVAAGGVAKLVRMCKERGERFDNDAILVATLATLRKITKACGNDIISVEDAQELVEPKLLDSFLAYSTQSESYV